MQKTIETVPPPFSLSRLALRFLCSQNNVKQAQDCTCI